MQRCFVAAINSPSLTASSRPSGSWCARLSCRQTRSRNTRSKGARALLTLAGASQRMQRADKQAVEFAVGAGLRRPRVCPPCPCMVTNLDNHRIELQSPRLQPVLEPRVMEDVLRTRRKRGWHAGANALLSTPGQACMQAAGPPECANERNAFVQHEGKPRQAPGGGGAAEAPLACSE